MEPSSQLTAETANFQAPVNSWESSFSRRARSRSVLAKLAANAMASGLAAALAAGSSTDFALGCGRRAARRGPAERCVSGGGSADLSVVSRVADGPVSLLGSKVSLADSSFVAESGDNVSSVPSSMLLEALPLSSRMFANSESLNSAFVTDNGSAEGRDRIESIIENSRSRSLKPNSRTIRLSV